MAAQNPPYSMQTGAHGAELFRRAVGSVLNTAGGVVALGDLAVTANSPAAMNVLVASGSIWIPGTTNTAQGMYHCFNDASVTLSITAASATNPRIDTIVAQVEDAAYAGATNAWKLAVVTGTATVGATLANLTGAGAVPASSLVLAYVLVAANATTIAAGAVQDNRIFSRPNLPMRSNPAGRLYLSSGNVSGSLVALNTSSFLKGGMTADLVTNRSLIAPIAGNYFVSGCWGVNTSGSGYFYSAIYKNGTLYSVGNQNYSPSANASYCVLSDIVSCSAGDNIQLGFGSSVGGTSITGSSYTYLSAALVSQ